MADRSINRPVVTRERSAAVQWSGVSVTFWIAAVASLRRNDGESMCPGLVKADALACRRSRVEAMFA